MKKTLKVLFIIFLSIFIISASFLIYCIAITKNVKLDEKKLINVDKSITYLYSSGEIILEEAKGVEICDISDIPKHVKDAFIAIEDRRFYQHNGIDYKGILRAIVKNVKSFSFKEGASTITQQLVKNTHLSNEKTLKRKISEFKIALEIERKFSKDEILEKYLNTIYFGSGKYGITEASKYYFSKTPKELTINEGAIRASIIKAPSIYSPTKNIDKCFERKNIVLNQMYNLNYVTHNQYENSKQLPCDINIYKSDNAYINLIKDELSNTLEFSPFLSNKLTVYTTIDKEKQEIIEANFKDIPHKNTGIILNKYNEIEAYYTKQELEKRNVGSTLKPLISFAPAIENNVVYPISKVLDEKQDFNGYSPSNYKNKYYGYISVKEALEKSLNTIAVKLLNDTGIERAKSYLNKMNFPLDSEDNHLALALGSTKYGATLLDVTSCYNVFVNDGNYYKPSIISKITSDSKTLYKKENYERKIFNDDTITLLNDMLLSTAKIGTAKKLSTLSFPIYSKTGTVGNEKGNTDAYSISYTKDNILGVWLGNNKDEYLDNSITGGGLPTEIALNIWKKVYKNKLEPSEIEKSSNTTYEYIDKLSYEKDNVVILADKNAPDRYKIKALFKSDNLPKETSTRFSSPKINDYNYTLENNKIIIKCTIYEGINYLIKRQQNGQEKIVFDSKMQEYGKNYEDTLNYNTEYDFTIIPYFNNEIETFYGESVKIKIKSPPFFDGDDWLNDDIFD